MKHFFILGPARCRTAWLAAFLTCGTVHCHHEASRLAKDGSDFNNLMSIDSCTVTGNSDSAVCLDVSWFLEHYPDARFLLVDRRFSHVIKSFTQHFGVKFHNDVWKKIFDLYCSARKQLIDHPNARRVLFDDLHDEKVIRDVWDYCTYDAPWQPDRYTLFKDLVIQVPRTYDLTYRSGFMNQLVKQQLELCQLS